MMPLASGWSVPVTGTVESTGISSASLGDAGSSAKLDSISSSSLHAPPPSLPHRSSGTDGGDEICVEAGSRRIMIKNTHLSGACTSPRTQRTSRGPKSRAKGANRNMKQKTVLAPTHKNLKSPSPVKALDLSCLDTVTTFVTHSPPSTNASNGSWMPACIHSSASTQSASCGVSGMEMLRQRWSKGPGRQCVSRASASSVALQLPSLGGATTGCKDSHAATNAGFEVEEDDSKYFTVVYIPEETPSALVLEPPAEEKPVCDLDGKLPDFLADLQHSQDFGWEMLHGFEAAGSADDDGWSEPFHAALAVKQEDPLECVQDCDLLYHEGMAPSSTADLDQCDLVEELDVLMALMVQH